MTGMPAAAATREAARRELHDRATDAATLARIAAAHPEFAAQIGRHPNAYPELRAWAAQAGLSAAASGAASAQADQDVALVAVGHGPAWIVALLILMTVQLTSSVVGLLSPDGGYGPGLWWLRPLGPLAFTVVALIAAPTVGRKIGAAVFGLLAAVAAVGLAMSPWVLGIFYVGVEGLVAVLTFLCWAIARPLRGAGYAVIPFVIVLPVVLGYVIGSLQFSLWIQLQSGSGPFSSSESASNSALNLLMFVVILLVRSVGLPLAVVGTARAWSRGSERRMQVRERVGASSSAAGAPTYPRTNTMAVLAIVFAFVFSILGIVFGHTALGQIRRTGEEGRGLAIAGLVIGYSSIGLGLLLIVGYAVTLGLIR